jgi:hypothetical protein
MSQEIINVSLKEFLRTGIFGTIKFGMSSHKIQELLGTPDFVFTGSRSTKPTGFEYGDVEFYFISTKDNRLCAIYLDEFDVPKGNQILNIDAWQLRSGKSQAEIETALIQAGIKFQPTKMPDPTMNGIVTEGGVQLGFIFEADEFSAPKGLYNISRELRAEMEIVAR